MPRLDLSDQEYDELRYVLESYLTDLRMEISNTDSKDFRDHLKTRENILKDVLARLGAPQWQQPGVSPG